MNRLVKHGDVRVVHNDLVAAKDSLHFVARFAFGEKLRDSAVLRLSAGKLFFEAIAHAGVVAHGDGVVQNIGRLFRGVLLGIDETRGQLVENHARLSRFTCKGAADARFLLSVALVHCSLRCR